MYIKRLPLIVFCCVGLFLSQQAIGDGFDNLMTAIRNNNYVQIKEYIANGVIDNNTDDYWLLLTAAASKGVDLDVLLLVLRSPPVNIGDRISGYAHDYKYYEPYYECSSLEKAVTLLEYGVGVGVNYEYSSFGRVISELKGERLNLPFRINRIRNYAVRMTVQDWDFQAPLAKPQTVKEVSAIVVDKFKLLQLKSKLVILETIFETDSIFELPIPEALKRALGRCVAP